MTDRPSEAEIRRSIREKYRAAARSAAGLFEYPTGADGARALGYDADVIANAPSELLGSFCGVGNPFAPGEIRAGETVLDVGCGAGFDVHVASRAVGTAGRVLGVDLTPEMVAVAADHAARSGLTNVTVQQADARSLPFNDETVDVVLSNGVFNLSPSKQEVFAEVFRVLVPGGRLQFADIVLADELPSEVAGSLEAWSH